MLIAGDGAQEGRVLKPALQNRARRRVAHLQKGKKTGNSTQGFYDRFHKYTGTAFRPGISKQSWRASKSLRADSMKGFMLLVLKMDNIPRQHCTICVMYQIKITAYVKLQLGLVVSYDLLVGLLLVCLQKIKNN